MPFDSLPAHDPALASIAELLAAVERFQERTRDLYDGEGRILYSEPGDDR